MPELETILNLLERLAPSELAEAWDRSGLQWGDLRQDVRRIVVGLDLDDECIDFAIRQGAELILVHHPPLFRPLQEIRWDQPVGARIFRCCREGIAVAALHTNLDAARDGVSLSLAKRLELEDTEPLSPHPGEDLYKLVVFVPPDHVEPVRDALAQSGAGWIGQYSHCTFQSEGIGTFKPLAGSNPYLGNVGELARVRELRLETIVPRSRLDASVQAMIQAHPYEEVAYDVYHLEIKQYRGEGFGRIGRLQQAKPLHQFATAAARVLNVSACRYAGPPDRLVQRVAVLGGSGMSFWKDAVRMQADVLVTGDIKYHEALDALERGLCLVDIGHDASEIPALTDFADRLKKELVQEGFSDVEVFPVAEELIWHGA